MVREISRKLNLRRLLSRSTASLASAALIAGATFWAPSAVAQQESPARYMPPVHVAPSAYSVTDSRPQPGAQTASAPLTEQQIEAARSLEIARMSEYMRRQNVSATAAQNAQVDAALFRKQMQRRQAVQAAQAGQQNYSAPSHQNFRPQQPQQFAQAQRLPQTRVRQTQVQRTSGQTQTQTAAVQPVRQTTYTQEVVPYSLQERISKAVKGRFSRPKKAVARATTPTQATASRDPITERVDSNPTRSSQSNQMAARVTREVSSSNGPDPRGRIADVARTEQTLEPIEPPVAESILIAPRLNAPGMEPESRSPRVGSNAQSVSRIQDQRDRTNVPSRDVRPEPRRQRSLEEVIVPSFVEANDFSRQTNSQRLIQQPVQLASARDNVIGSGVRKPRVSSRPRPMSYGAPAQTQAEGVSIFQRASSKMNTAANSPQDDRFSPEDEISRLNRELGEQESKTPANELPLRRPMPDGSGLLDLQDEANRGRALDARRRADTEMDSLEDESIDLGDDFDDEDDEPTVLDDRSCDEFRALLLDKSIRDISLDISPPSSARLQEMESLSRSWTDTAGNVIATGTMIDLRRGYVILDTGQKLPYAKLAEADWAAIADYWQLPSTCSIGQRGSLARNWIPQSVTWHASSLCHKPLYFENRQLERYGHSRGPFMQPVQSTLHFFGSLFFLPYNTAINPPNECQYALGFYRPGNCAPWLLDPIPFSRAGLRRQALVATGLSFIP